MQDWSNLDIFIAKFLGAEDMRISDDDVMYVEALKKYTVIHP